jgi:GT2 family glycosyltransferase
MLGFFFRHYDRWVDKYVVYDDGSTDGSLEILKAHPKVELRQLQRVDANSFVVSHTQMQERAWKESRGQADWVVITAIDEHLWVRGVEITDYLQGLREAGVTCVPALGFDMNSEELPRDCGLLIEAVTCGRARRFFNKLSIFNPDAVDETRFVEGRHSAMPSGRIVFPSRDGLLLWHYKHLGFERVAARHEAQGARLGSKDRANGWGHRYLWPRERLAWQWRAMRATSTDLADLTDPALSCERPLWWRPEQRLSDLLAPQGSSSGSGSRRPPRVSVVVKSFNHEKYARHCIQSVLNQSFQDFELIVTDDASTDDTVAVVRSFSDSRIKLDRLPDNRGISGAMNAAISRATGEYIAILNSDDWALPDRLETQVAFMDAHPDVGVLFGIPTFVDDRDELTNGFNDFRLPLRFPDFSQQTWLRHFFFYGNCLCAPTAMARREVFLRVGDYDVRLTNLQDLDYWVRVLIAGFGICVEDREVTAFRIREGHRNMSAPRTETILRSNFEYPRILRHFQSINPELLADGPTDDNLSPASRLARLAFSVGGAVHEDFGLETLYQHAKGTHDLVLLRELTGSADVYGRLANAGLSDRIRDLEGMLKEARQQAAPVAHANAELSHRIGHLEAKLAKAQQQADQTIQASARAEAELARLVKSRSWRYTEGLRRVFSVIQRVRGEAARLLGHAQAAVTHQQPTSPPRPPDKPLSRRRVFDCFLYSGQATALVSRLQRLSKVVDVFVLVDHGCQFDPFDPRVGAFITKIRYVPATDTDICGWQCWEHNAVWRGAPDAAATDLLLLSEVSDVPPAAAIAEIPGNDDNEVFELSPTRAFMSWRRDRMGTLAVIRRILETNSPVDLRRTMRLTKGQRAPVGKRDGLAIATSVVPKRRGATLPSRVEWQIRRSRRPKLPPVVICPYLYGHEESEIRLKFGLDTRESRHIEFFLWHDTDGIGPELAFEHCWDRFPDRDIVIIHSDMAPMAEEPCTQWYDALVSFSATTPAAGILACNLYHTEAAANGFPNVQSAGGTFVDGKIYQIRGPLNEPGGVSRELLGQVRIVDWTTFGGVLVRREVIRACGHFDRRYKWAYVMDVDYCLEARLRGFQIVQVPAFLQHEESRTTQSLVRQNPNLESNVRMNFEQFYAKWRPFYPLLVKQAAERPSTPRDQWTGSPEMSLEQVG